MHQSLAIVVLAVLLFQDPAAFDYATVDRKIAKQPSYVGKPQYALLLVGSDAKHHVWMALDRSEKEQAHPNVLYIDRDADGTLGEEGERIVATSDDGEKRVWKVGKLELKDAKILLEDFELAMHPGQRPAMTLLTFRMNDKVDLSGVYGPNNTFLEFADSPEKAPVLHADPWGPLAFYHAGPDEMRIGRDEIVMLYVGPKGSGPATFLAVDEDFLDLEKDKLFVTLTAKDSKGKEIVSRAQLKEHC